MTTQEFKKAFALADSDVDLSEFATNAFDGFGLYGFEPITCTIPQLAWLIRWQAKLFNGGWHNENLDEIRKLGKHRFIVLDGNPVVKLSA